MTSWNLKDFVKKHGPVLTSKIWGVSHQAVQNAVNANRDIQVTLINGLYEIHESKVLGKAYENEL